MLLRFISILIIITLPRFAYCLTEVVDGITWTYTVSNGVATVGGGSSASTAIATSTSGAITMLTTLVGVTHGNLDVGSDGTVGVNVRATGNAKFFKVVVPEK
jgi:hypothetical protein